GRVGALRRLAISGVHVVLAAALLGRGVALAGLRGRTAALCRLAGVVLYSGLAGGSASVWRAGVSGALAEAAAVSGRHLAAEQALALAVILLVSGRPAFALDAGFELSALATWGLLGLAGPVVRAGKVILGEATRGRPRGGRALVLGLA